MDAFRSNSVKIIHTKRLNEFGTVDILVNNAGTVGDGGTLEETSLEAWRSLASDKASFINGANFRIDGGSVAFP